MESSSDKALVTAIFPSTDPTVLSYNLKRKAAERKDEEYESIGSESNEKELDSTQIAQIWHDMAKLKREEAALYDKLAKAAPMMTSGGFDVFCGEDPSSYFTAATVHRGYVHQNGQSSQI